tara:strand:- start:5755 stop:5877 length:123 start_codon:yes stop_codon:yes gene_type:complete
MVAAMDVETFWNWVLLAILAILILDVWIRRGWENKDDDDY